MSVEGTPLTEAIEAQPVGRSGRPTLICNNESGTLSILDEISDLLLSRGRKVVHSSNIADMTSEAGFRVERTWTDPREWFSVQYCARD